jgi:hypothetical protein
VDRFWEAFASDGAFDAFLERCWGKQHHFSRGGASARSFLVECLGGATAETLVPALASSSTRRWVPGEQGRYDSLPVSSDQLRDLLTVDGTLYFTHVERQVPALGELLKSAKDRLPLTAAPAVDVFVSRGTVRTRSHYDLADNFTVQLTGKKVWHIAPNHTFDQPTNGYITGQPLPFELRLAAVAPPPADVPPGAQRIELEPGSVLYLPAGHWHAAEPAGDSESVSVVLRLPRHPWLEGFAPVLRGYLASRRAWRMTASPTLTTEGASAEELEALLSCVDLNALARDLLRPLAPAPARKGPWRRDQRVIWRSVGEALEVWSLQRGGRVLARLEPTPELVALLAWLGDHSAAFGMKELERALKKVRPPAIRRAVQALAEAGVLRPEKSGGARR